MSKQGIIVRESPLRALLRKNGIEPEMLEAARLALSTKKKGPFQYRKDIIVSGILGAGIYVLASVAGGKLHPLAALAIGAALALFFSWIDRSGFAGRREGCERLMFHTRYGVDFSRLARELYQADPELAQDLRDVLAAGSRDPGALSDYSILHLWECIRVRIAEFEVPR